MTDETELIQLPKTEAMATSGYGPVPPMTEALAARSASLPRSMEEVAEQNILRGLWEARYAVFQRTHEANVTWGLVGILKTSALVVFWKNKSAFHDYIVVDLNARQVVQIETDEDTGAVHIVRTKDEYKEPIELHFSFRFEDDEVEEAFGPGRSPVVYEASIQAAIELIHDAGLDVDDSYKKVFPPDDVVGGTIQSLIMAGYQQAMSDIVSGKVSITDIFHESHILSKLKE